MRMRTSVLLTLTMIVMIAYSSQAGDIDLAINTPDKLQVYKSENLLRNGDFTGKSFLMSTPLFWIPSYNSAVPEQRDNYVLENSVLSFNAPYKIMQSNDFTPEIATEYVLSFKALVEKGSLTCSITYREKHHGGIRSQLLSEKIETILVPVIEREVKKEIEKLRGLLMDDEN